MEPHLLLLGCRSEAPYIPGAKEDGWRISPSGNGTSRASRAGAQLGSSHIGRSNAPAGRRVRRVVCTPFGMASHLQANNVPADFTKSQVGHSSLRTTSGYTHFSEDFARETVERLASELPSLDSLGKIGLSRNSGQLDVNQIVVVKYEVEFRGRLAQRLEHPAYTGKVRGSNP